MRVSAHLLTPIIVAAVLAAPRAQVAAPPDVAAPPADAVKAPSGLATKVLARGSGKDHPTKDDVVVVHYTGWKKLSASNIIAEVRFEESEQLYGMLMISSVFAKQRKMPNKSSKS